MAAAGGRETAGTGHDPLGVELVMRATAVMLFVALAAAATAGAGGLQRDGGPATRTVTCAESIDRTVFPYIGSRSHRYRTVLGVVSAPPALLEAHHHPQAVDWPYFAKSGLVVRSTSQTVTITVPEAFRRRVAIGWGNADGAYAVVKIVGCGSDPRAGHAYAGGFGLRTASACVPLRFRVGDRTATLRFGLGRRCPTA
jgi:hypothetical protein